MLTKFGGGDIIYVGILYRKNHIGFCQLLLVNKKTIQEVTTMKKIEWKKHLPLIMAIAAAILVIVIIIIIAAGGGADEPGPNDRNNNGSASVGNTDDSTPETDEDDDVEDGEGNGDGEPAEKVFDVWDGSVADGFGGGDGFVDSPYLINTCAELAYLAKRLSSGNDVLSAEGVYFKLCANLDLNNINWLPIGSSVNISGESADNTVFRGNFDGNGMTVKNLSLTSVKSYAMEAGLFGRSENASVYGLNLEDVTLNAGFSTKASVGLLMGSALETKITECNITNGNLSADGCIIGGLIANGDGITLENCRLTGMTVAGANGGMAAGCLINSQCRSIDAEGNATFKKSNEDKYYVGGLIGSLTDSAADGCNVKGTLTFRTSDSLRTCTGGFIGACTGSYLTASSADVDVKANGDYLSASGFIGSGYDDSIVADCYAAGSVSADYQAQGFGVAVRIIRCIAYGNVSAGNSYFSVAYGFGPIVGGDISSSIAFGDVHVGSNGEAYPFGTGGGGIYPCYRSESQKVTVGSSASMENTFATAVYFDELSSADFYSYDEFFGYAWDMSEMDIENGVYPKFRDAEERSACSVQITTPLQLMSLSGVGYYAEIVDSDIDMTGVNWQPIIGFTGDFACGNVIKNLSFSTPGDYYIFNELVGNAIVRIENISLSGEMNFLGIAKENNGKLNANIRYVNVTNLKGEVYLASEINNGIINPWISDVEIGGLNGSFSGCAKDNYGIIEDGISWISIEDNCGAISFSAVAKNNLDSGVIRLISCIITDNDAKLITDNSDIAGVSVNNRGKINDCSVLGRFYADINNSYSSSVVSSSLYVGGVAAINYGTIETCFANVSVIASVAADNSARDSGWINPGVSKSFFRFGGIAAYNDGTLKGCFASTEVSATVTATDRTGQYTSTASAGYIIGYAELNSVVEKCYYETPSSFNVTNLSAEQSPITDGSLGVDVSVYDTDSFYKETLGFSDEYWNFPESNLSYDYPALK